MFDSSSIARLAPLLPVILLGACSREGIRVYQAPKAAPPPSPAMRQAAGASTEHLHWELPPGWEEVPASGPRTATFNIHGSGSQRAEVAIMPFRRMNASEAEYVNLWRTSLGLEPVTPEAAAGMVESIPIGEEAGTIFDVRELTSATDAAHTPPTSLLVAMAVRGDTSWFFKLAGDAALIENQRDAFAAFLKTISFHASDEHADGSAAQVDSPAPSPGVSGPARPEWDVPPGWQEAPPTALLLAKFVLAGASEATADVTVSVFPGDVGGLLANVNRWRGQVGQPALSAAELAQQTTPLEVGGGPATLLDARESSAESGASRRVLGAIVPRGDQTWFFKLLGDAAVVEQQKDAFLKFLQSVRYPDA